ncbi:MAG: cupin domain-containing protein [Amaricoccus sp.]
MPKLTLPEPVFETAAGYAPAEEDPGPFASVAAGEIGGLTQFGARIETLPPGSASSMRHWHSHEDEFVLVLEGRLVLEEEGGETPLGPGEAAAFPAGRPNGHVLRNRSDGPATFLVVGNRDARDVCTYAGRDRMSFWRDGRRQVTRRDGTPLAAPDAPVGRVAEPPYDGPGGWIDIARAPVRTGSSYPEPYAALVATRSWQRLGDAGGLMRFGINLVTIPAGTISSLRHWHTTEDEFVLMRSGTLVLVEDDDEAEMRAGDVAAFPAGRPVGHHFRNESGAPATFLVVGTRAPAGVCHYSEADLVAMTEGGRAWYARRDGTLVKEL